MPRPSLTSCQSLPGKRSPLAPVLPPASRMTGVQRVYQRRGAAVAVGSPALAVDSAGRSGACLSVSGGALVSAAMGATRSSSTREMEPGESLAGYTGMDGAISLQEQRENALS